MASPTPSPTPSASYLAESKATQVNIFYSIPIALEVFSTVARLAIKASRGGGSRFAFDDYLIVVSTVFAVAECICGLVFGAPYGLGRHRAAVSDYEFMMYMKGNYIFSHFYDLAIGCTKLSVLALYYRLFSAITWFRNTLIATAAFVTAWIVAIEVTLGFSCRPVQAFWGAAPGTCVDMVAFSYFTNITNMVADLWIFAVPIPVILALRASKDYKIELIFVFCIGVATCGVSAARLSFIFGVGSDDVTWHEASLGILSAWEPCGGILCANLPVIYGPFKKYIGTVRTTLTGITTDSHAAATDRDARSRRKSRSDWERSDWERLNSDFGAAPERCSEAKGTAANIIELDSCSDVRQPASRTPAEIF